MIGIYVIHPLSKGLVKGPGWARAGIGQTSNDRRRRRVHVRRDRGGAPPPPPRSFAPPSEQVEAGDVLIGFQVGARRSRPAGVPRRTSRALDLVGSP